jgi:hypothetical protein
MERNVKTERLCKVNEAFNLRWFLAAQIITRDDRGAEIMKLTAEMRDKYESFSSLQLPIILRTCLQFSLLRLHILRCKCE